jgi:hypothetical protein
MRTGRPKAWITARERRDFAEILRKLWQMPKEIREQQPSWRALMVVLELTDTRL